MSDTGKKSYALLVSLALFFTTFAVFWPVTRCEFVNYDDPYYLTQNPNVQHGVTPESVWWAFTARHSSNWHPLTWLSHMVDWDVFGPSPAGHHFVNLLLHSTNAVLVFLLLLRMTRDRWPSAFVAALFALHPIHVESVAWISERKDVLSTCFGMLSLWFYTGYAESKIQKSKSEIRNFVLALFFFACSLMSKPMLVTLPLLMLLLDFWPLNRAAGNSGGGIAQVLSPATRYTRLLVEKFPFFALSAASCGLTLWAQSRTVQSVQHLPVLIRGFNAVFSCGRYLAKTIYPAHLTVHYPFIQVWSLVQVASVALFLLGASVFALRRMREHPFLAVGWFWYLVALVPVIGLVQVGTQAMADRYTYVPMLGVFIAVAWAVNGMVAGGRLKPAVAATAGAAVLIACIPATRAQIGHWQNSVALFEHTLQYTTGNFLAHYNLGVSYMERDDLKTAQEQFIKAVAVNANYPEARNNLANTYILQGRPDLALEHHEASLKLRPDSAWSHYNLGLTLADLGRYDEAMTRFETAMKLAPDFPLVRRDMALALLDKGDFEAATKRLQEYLAISPGDAEARVQLGYALGRLNRGDESESAYATALQLQPKLPEFLAKAAKMLADLNRTNRATRCLDVLVHISPGDADAHEQFGLLLANFGQTDAAIAQFRETVRLRPDAVAHYHLGLAYVIKQHAREAVEEYREAVRLQPDWPVALNDLAWLLATHPDKTIRNGAEAVQLAERACNVTHYETTLFIGTLAACYAEAGRFGEAITTAQRAHACGLIRGENELAEKNLSLLRLYYQKHEAYREK